MSVVKSVMLAELLLEANENLVGTRFYQKEFKRDLNRCMVSLDKYTKAYYNDMYDNDPQMVTNILNKIDNLLELIKEASVEDLVMIETLIEKYNEDKTLFRENEEIMFNKLK